MDKVRVGLVGSSGWTEFMFLPALRSHPAAELVAVCSRNTERVRANAAFADIPHVHADYREMLAAGGLDAAIVAVPDDLHNPITLAALDAGLHVLCEKPLAGNADDAAQMLARAEAAQRNHLVHFTWRWQPHFQYLKALVDEGRFGRILRAQFSFFGGWAHRHDYQWRLDARRANGILGDLGSHMIDLALWIVGDIVAVSADAPRLIERTNYGGDPLPANDTAVLTLEFGNGAQGMVDASTLTRHGDAEVSFTVRLDGTRASAWIHWMPFGANPRLIFEIVEEAAPSIRPVAIPEAYYPEGDRAPMAPYVKGSSGARLFVDSILLGFKPQPGFEQGVAVQRVVDMALRSHRERRWMEVPR